MRRLALLVLAGSLAACARTDVRAWRDHDAGATADAGGGADGGPATLESIEVLPAAAKTGAGFTVHFDAAGHYSDGAVRALTDQVTWASTDDTVARPTTLPGTFLAVKPGGVQVSASLGSATGTAALTVTGAPAVKLTVSPPSATIALGQSQQFSATAILADGTRADATGIATWAATPAGIATAVAGQPGSFSGAGVGDATITATLGTLEAAATLSVGQGALAALDVAPQTAKLPPGATGQFTCTALYASGTRGDVTKLAAWTSDDPAVASFDPQTPGLLRANKAGPAAVTCVYGGMTGTASVVVTSATLTALALTPPSASLAAGLTQPFTATGTFSDGSTSDLTTAAAWSTADAAVATVSGAPGSQGVVTAVAPGATTLTATVLGLTATAGVTVTTATLQSLTVTPASATLRVNSAVDLKCFGLYSDGQTRDVTLSAGWTSSAPAVASVSSAGGTQGHVVGLSPGAATIGASLGNLSATAAVAVSAAKLVGLAVNPSTLQMSYGWTRQLSAIASYDDGTTQDVTQQSTWTSSDTNVAVVSNASGSAGLVTSLPQDGTAIVTASFQGLTATCTVTVALGQLQSLQISPIDPSVPAATVVRFQAIAILTDGSAFYVTRQAAWSSSDPSVAKLDPNRPGAALALSPGSSTITASLKGQSASTTMTVTGATLTEVQVAPVNPSVPAGSYIGFSATAIYSDGTALDVTFGRQTSWVSSDPNVVDPSYGGYAVSPGQATVTATYQGLSGSTLVTVTAATVKQLQVSPIDPTLAVNTQLRFRATAIFTDNTSQDVSYFATWESSNAGVAQVSNAGFQTGVATAIAPGSTTISAIYDGVTGTTTLTVSSATLAQIQVTPFSPTLPAGTQVQMRATAIYSDGTSRDVTGPATWLTADPSVAQVANSGPTTGVLSALAVGSTAVTATYGGVTGQTTATVTAATLTRIQVAPGLASYPVGFDVAFTATAIFSDNTTRIVTGGATWLSSDASVAAVSDTSGSKGEARTLAPGSAAISATWQGVTGDAQLTVTSATLASLVVAPSPASASVGGSVQLAATATYSDGSTYDVTSSTFWSSSNVSVADVAVNGGLAWCYAAGDVTVTATFPAGGGTSVTDALTCQ